MLWNSVSPMVFLLAAQASTSLPTRYRRFGLLLLTASRIAFETTSTEEAFFEEGECINLYFSVEDFKTAPLRTLQR